MKKQLLRLVVVLFYFSVTCLCDLSIFVKTKEDRVVIVYILNLWIRKSKEYFPLWSRFLFWNFLPVHSLSPACLSNSCKRNRLPLLHLCDFQWRRWQQKLHSDTNSLASTPSPPHATWLQTEVTIHHSRRAFSSPPRQIPSPISWCLHMMVPRVLCLPHLQARQTMARAPYWKTF